MLLWRRDSYGEAVSVDSDESDVSTSVPAGQVEAEPMDHFRVLVVEVVQPD